MFFGFVPDIFGPFEAVTRVYPNDLSRSQLQQTLSARADIETQYEKEREQLELLLEQEAEPERLSSSSAADWLGSLVVA